MRSETTHLLRCLQTIDWFMNVGQPIKRTDVARVYSWKDALACTLSVSWADLILEAGHNDLTAQLARSDALDDLWEKVVRQVRPKVIGMVEEKTAEVSRNYSLPKTFSDDVRWCVLHACLETEFRGKLEGDFNTKLIC